MLYLVDQNTKQGIWRGSKLPNPRVIDCTVAQFPLPPAAVFVQTLSVTCSGAGSITVDVWKDPGTALTLSV